MGLQPFQGCPRPFNDQLGDLLESILSGFTRRYSDRRGFRRAIAARWWCRMGSTKLCPRIKSSAGQLDGNIPPSALHGAARSNGVREAAVQCPA